MAKVSFVVRRGVLSDLISLTTLTQNLAAETENGLQLDTEKLQIGITRGLQFISSSSAPKYWVATTTDTQELIGFAAVSPEWSDWWATYYWWIISVFVDAKWRRNGVASSLIQKLQLDAEAEQVQTVNLRVEKNNATAQSLYKRLGFAEDDSHIVMSCGLRPDGTKVGGGDVDVDVRREVRLVAGLMSGTSCDAVDCALIWTDGHDVLRLGPTSEILIPANLRVKVRAMQRWAEQSYWSQESSERQHLLDSWQSLTQIHKEGSAAPHPYPPAVEIERELTSLHIAAVKIAMEKLPIKDRSDLSLIGYHGNTICHFPPSRQQHNRDDDQEINLRQRPCLTWQLGDGQRLANELHTPVVFRFRDRDVAAGGEGAPLAPAYHRALCSSCFSTTAAAATAHNTAATVATDTIAILNIGGVSNITICRKAKDGEEEHSNMLAFDVGPGNAMLDDFMLSRIGTPIDKNGESACKGKVNIKFIQHAMQGSQSPLHQFLPLCAPKSCDRDQFILSLDKLMLSSMSTEDGAASLTKLTAMCVADALSRVSSWTQSWTAPLSSLPSVLIVTGGGRKNAALMQCLQDSIGNGVRVISTESMGWRGDSVEAEAFAYLARRSVLGLPISWSGTTRARGPTCGGVLVKPVCMGKNEEQVDNGLVRGTASRRCMLLVVASVLLSVSLFVNK